MTLLTWQPWQGGGVGEPKPASRQTEGELGSIPNTPVLLTLGLRQPPDSSAQ